MSQWTPDHPWNDFRNFMYSVWMFLDLPDPTPVQYDVAYALQHGTDRDIIEAYRGMGKSYITSAFAVWNWWKNTDCRIMVVSGGKDRADAFSRFCLRLLQDMPELKHLAPRRDQLKSLAAFEVNGARPDHSPSCKSVGITGQLTGSRADIIIADDVETPKNSLTVTQREKLEVLVTEFDAVIKAKKYSPDAKIIYLGTPQIEDSLYNKLTHKGYRLQIWPARMPNVNTAQDKYSGHLAPYILGLALPEGTPIDPLRFDEADLQKREASYGRTGFALQFMLDTSLEDSLKYPLRCSDFIVMDIDREIAPVKVTYGSSMDQELKLDCGGRKGDRWFSPMYVSKDFIEFTGSVMFVDPSGRGKDKTGFAVVKTLNGMLYVRRVGNVEGGYDTSALTTLAHIARAEKVNDIVIESNFGDGMFTALFKPVLNSIYRCNVEEKHHSGQKELRIIDTLEPLLNQHRLVIDRQAIVHDSNEDTSYSLMFQLTRVTRERNSLQHDDSLESLAGACNYWTEKLDLSVDDSEDRHKQELFDADLDAFMEGAGGASKRGNYSFISNV